MKKNNKKKKMTKIRITRDLENCASFIIFLGELWLEGHSIGCNKVIQKFLTRLQDFFPRLPKLTPFKINTERNPKHFRQIPNATSFSLAIANNVRR